MILRKLLLRHIPRFSNSPFATVSATFELVPGKYSVLVCTYEPDKENTFTLRALSAKAILQSFPKQYHIATCSVRCELALSSNCSIAVHRA
jgi:hypothetical protein